MKVIFSCLFLSSAFATKIPFADSTSELQDEAPQKSLATSPLEPLESSKEDFVLDFKSRPIPKKLEDSGQIVLLNQENKPVFIYEQNIQNNRHLGILSSDRIFSFIDYSTSAENLLATLFVQKSSKSYKVCYQHNKSINGFETFSICDEWIRTKSKFIVDMLAHHSSLHHVLPDMILEHDLKIDCKSESCVISLQGSGDQLLSLLHHSDKQHFELSSQRIRRIDGPFPYKNALILDLSNNFIDDTIFLAHLKNIRILNLNRNKIADLTPLSALVLLECLYANENCISNIKPLTDLTLLRVLHLKNNVITSLNADLSFLSLADFDLEGNKINDIYNVSRFKRLKNFTITGKHLTSLLPLLDCKYLEKLTFKTISSDAFWGHEISLLQKTLPSCKIEELKTPVTQQE